MKRTPFQKSLKNRINNLKKTAATPEYYVQLKYLNKIYEGGSNRGDLYIDLFAQDKAYFSNAKLRVYIDASCPGISIVPEAIDNRDPPKLAEFLLIAFATTRHAAHVVGDRNEVFARECEEFGRDRAVRRYWADTLRSLWPLLRRVIGKALKWGAVIATVRRFF
jgi:hypothetical protein